MGRGRVSGQGLGKMRPWVSWGNGRVWARKLLTLQDRWAHGVLRPGGKPQSVLLEDRRGQEGASAAGPESRALGLEGGPGRGICRPLWSSVSPQGLPGCHHQPPGPALALSGSPFSPFPPPTLPSPHLLPLACLGCPLPGRPCSPVPSPLPFSPPLSQSSTLPPPPLSSCPFIAIFCALMLQQGPRHRVLTPSPATAAPSSSPLSLELPRCRGLSSAFLPGGVRLMELSVSAPRNESWLPRCPSRPPHSLHILGGGLATCRDRAGSDL